MHEYLQLAIAMLIIAAVFFTVWRHGRSNPEGTGTLARRIASMERQVAETTSTLEGCATRGALDLVAEQLRSLEGRAASSGEVVALEGKINVIGERVAGVAASSNETREGVKRIEAILMKDALQR